MLIGSSYLAFVLATTSEILATLNMRNLAIKKRLTEVKEWAEDRHLPAYLRTRIEKYYVYLLNCKLHSEKEVLGELSSSLRNEVVAFSKAKLITSLDIFKGLEPSFITALIVHMRPFTAMPGETIMQEGDVSLEIYFLVRGSVELSCVDPSSVLTFFERERLKGEKLTVKGHITRDPKLANEVVSAIQEARHPHTPSPAIPFSNPFTRPLNLGHFESLKRLGHSGRVKLGDAGGKMTTARGSGIPGGVDEGSGVGVGGAGGGAVATDTAAAAAAAAALAPLKSIPTSSSSLSLVGIHPMLHKWMGGGNEAGKGDLSGSESEGSDGEDEETEVVFNTLGHHHLDATSPQKTVQRVDSFTALFVSQTKNHLKSHGGSGAGGFSVNGGGGTAPEELLEARKHAMEVGGVTYTIPVPSTAQLYTLGALTDGKAFGDDGVLLGLPRAMTARASTPCDLQIITASTFCFVLAQFPKQQAHFIKMAEEKGRTTLQEKRELALTLSTLAENRSQASSSAPPSPPVGGSPQSAYQQGSLPNAPVIAGTSGGACRTSESGGTSSEALLSVNGVHTLAGDTVSGGSSLPDDAVAMQIPPPPPPTASNRKIHPQVPPKFNIDDLLARGLYSSAEASCVLEKVRVNWNLVDSAHLPQGLLVSKNIDHSKVLLRTIHPPLLSTRELLIMKHSSPIPPAWVIYLKVFTVNFLGAFPEKILGQDLWKGVIQARTERVDECNSETRKEEGEQGVRGGGAPFMPPLKGKGSPHEQDISEEMEDVETTSDLFFRGIIDPGAFFKLRWDVFILFLALFVAVEVPLVLGFQLNTEPPSTLYYIDTLVNVCFILDLVISFRTAYMDPQLDLLVTTPWRVSSAYLHSYFLIDFVSSFPFDAIVQASIVESSNIVAQAQSVKLIRLVRVLRVTRLLRLAKSSHIFPTLANWLSLRPAVTNVIMLLFQLFFTAHWYGCFFAFCVGEEEGSRQWWLPNFNKSVNGGSTADSVVSHSFETYSLGSRYLAAMYWAITTATTTGYGDILPLTDTQRVFNVVGMMVTAIVFGYAVGSVANVWEEMTASSSHRTKRQSEVSQYVKDRNLPTSLGRRIRHYFTRYLARKSAFSEEEILGELTEGLRRETTLFLKKDVFHSIPLFSTFLDAEMVSLGGEGVALPPCVPPSLLPKDPSKTPREAAPFSFFPFRIFSKKSTVHPWDTHSHQLVPPPPSVAHSIDTNLLYRIVSALRPQFALPGEYLIREGESPIEIVYLVLGKLKLLRRGATKTNPLQNHHSSFSPPVSSSSSSGAFVTRTTTEDTGAGVGLAGSKYSSSPPHPSTTNGEGCEEEEIGVLEVGGCVGEAAILLNHPHTFSAKAITPVHVYVLPREALSSLCKLYPTLGAHISKDLVEYTKAWALREGRALS